MNAATESAPVAPGVAPRRRQAVVKPISYGGISLTDTAVIHLGLQTMIIALKLGTPVLATALVIGFAISVFQSATQIQESTLSFVPKVLGVAFRQEATSERDLVSLFVRLAERARREGLLALESEAAEIHDKGIQKGVLLVVDGTDPDLVREIMESDVAAMSERHEGKFAMFAAAGGFAPTMGIIGTVMGLVNVLSHLDKPDELGKSIATAFIATLYGVLSANVFWLPVGERLKQLRAELVITDEQMVQFAETADDARLRALVSETPLADRDHHEAQRHADAMGKHRAEVLSTIEQLEQRQDELLDRLSAER